MSNVSFSLESETVTTTTASCDAELNTATRVGTELSNGVYSYTVDRKQQKNAIKKYYCRLNKTRVLYILALAVVWILYTIPIIIFYAIDGDLRVSESNSYYLVNL